jgi:hypothetical protein
MVKVNGFEKTQEGKNMGLGKKRQVKNKKNILNGF